VKIVQAHKNSFILVVRLFSGVLKSSFEIVMLEFGFSSEIEPSEKYSVFVSDEVVVIVSQTLYIFLLLSVTVNICSSGL